MPVCVVTGGDDGGEDTHMQRLTVSGHMCPATHSRGLFFLLDFAASTSHSLLAQLSHRWRQQ